MHATNRPCVSAPLAPSVPCSYEEWSPRPKQRGPCTPEAAALGAPWRVSLRDASDELLFCARGLPQQLQLDLDLCLAVSGCRAGPPAIPSRLNAWRASTASCGPAPAV